MRNTAICCDCKREVPTGADEINVQRWAIHFKPDGQICASSNLRVVDCPPLSPERAKAEYEAQVTVATCDFCGYDIECRPGTDNRWRRRGVYGVYECYEDIQGNRHGHWPREEEVVTEKEIAVTIASIKQAYTPRRSA